MCCWRRVRGAPDAPTGFGATAGNGFVRFAWTKGADNGSAISTHQYCQKTNSSDMCATSDWTDIPMSGAGGDNEAEPHADGPDQRHGAVLPRPCRERRRPERRHRRGERHAGRGRADLARKSHAVAEDDADDSGPWQRQTWLRQQRGRAPNVPPRRCWATTTSPTMATRDIESLFLNELGRGLDGGVAGLPAGIAAQRNRGPLHLAPRRRCRILRAA